MLLLALMVLGAITGVPTPACLSAASNPVEAVTPPFFWGWQLQVLGTQRTLIAGFEASAIGRDVRLV